MAKLDIVQKELKFGCNEYNFRMRKQMKVVLLVDDDPSDRKLFSRFLEKLGMKVVSTGDPDRAMQLIVAGDVGCLITDQKMQPSGHELVRVVKSVRSDIGMILLSGADCPSEPLPPEILFINKRDKNSLAQAVLDCMKIWLR